MASNHRKKTGGPSSGPKGFATNRDRIRRTSRVMALILVVVMVVFMLLSSSMYLFN